MQNNYQGYSVFNPLPQQQPQKDNPITGLKRKFQNMNKNVLIGILIVIAAGFVVGGIITVKNRNNGQVEGALTEDLSTSTPISTGTPTDAPTDQPIVTPTDTSAEGAAPTNSPSNTPTLTASPTPSPTSSPTPSSAPYTISVTSANPSPSPVPADGSSTFIFVVNVQGGSGGGGETVNLIPNSSNVNIIPSTVNADSSGNATFTVTSRIPGTYNITPNVWGTAGNAVQIIFASPTP